MEQLGWDPEKSGNFACGAAGVGVWILEGTDPSKGNVQAARCTREVNRAARWVGNVANIQCC